MHLILPQYGTLQGSGPSIVKHHGCSCCMSSGEIELAMRQKLLASISSIKGRMISVKPDHGKQGLPFDDLLIIPIYSCPLAERLQLFP